MSYCLNPDCLEPGRQRTPNPDQARFCSNCGAALLLGDRYRAKRPIGQGRFGKTFIGIDEHKPSKPSCVIKQSLIRNQTETDADRHMLQFWQEAMRLEELGQHPQIPALLAYFEHDCRHYLIQEFIDGQNLQQRLRRTGTYEEKQIRHILSDVLPILQFIHAHQVIHRDIKPENIICRQRDVQLVLVDFGAAKFATPGSLLQPGTKMGNRGYTAPEQSVGRASFSSDLYSLGATCVHLLTQKPPALLLDRTQQIWNWRPHLTHSISQSMEHILDTLLQVNPSDRYTSAEEVLADLDRSASDALSNRPTFVPLRKRNLSNDREMAHEIDKTGTNSAQVARWRCCQTWVGHSAWVRSVALSADGQRLASGSGDKTVKIWSVPQGTLLHTLTGHTSWVRGVAIAPHQPIAASASNDRTIRLWNINTGESLAILNGHSDWVRSVTFSPDGKYLISGSQDKTLRLWQLTDGESIQTFTGHDHWVLTTAISLDGQTLASGSRDHTIRIWRPKIAQCCAVLAGHTAEILSVAIHPNGLMLASGSADQTVRLWDLRSFTLIKTLHDHKSAVNAVTFSPDGQTLATAGSDKTIRIWDVETRQCQEILEGHLGWVWAIAFTQVTNAASHNQRLVSGSWDGALKIWETDCRQHQA